ncbi:hypothetical protein D6827_00820 [Candidatus Parcubacteria bacterium]|nr:MAG: hypothetical protein D6827_00820 [Candidatus Parcubacteria bacterium]
MVLSKPKVRFWCDYTTKLKFIVSQKFLRKRRFAAPKNYAAVGRIFYIKFYIKCSAVICLFLV